MSDDFLKRVKVVKQTGTAAPSKPSTKTGTRVVHDSVSVAGLNSNQGKVSHFVVNESLDNTPKNKK